MVFILAAAIECPSSRNNSLLGLCLSCPSSCPGQWRQTSAKPSSRCPRDSWRQATCVCCMNSGVGAMFRALAGDQTLFSSCHVFLALLLTIETTRELTEATGVAACLQEVVPKVPAVLAHIWCLLAADLEILATVDTRYLWWMLRVQGPFQDHLGALVGTNPTECELDGLPAPGCCDFNCFQGTRPASSLRSGQSLPGTFEPDFRGQIFGGISSGHASSVTAVLLCCLDAQHWSEVLTPADCCKAQDPLNHPGACLAMHVVAGLHQATWVGGVKVGWFCHNSQSSWWWQNCSMLFQL